MPIAQAFRRGLAGVPGWIRTWAGVLPLLAAEFILWTGFGALLPVMPLYFTEHGVDVAFLGVVIAAWPAARLFTEPLFGAIADRTARVPLMILGLVIAGAAVGGMVIWTAPAAFIALRAASGLGTAIYDPAARGYLMDGAPSGRQGEVFGLYNAAQMGGILLGPAIGGVGTAVVGSFTFVLGLSAVTTFIAAIAVAVRVRELPRAPGATAESRSATAQAEFPAELGPDRGAARSSTPDAPASLRNPFIAAAIIVNLAGYFGGGMYETIWALFVVDRGGGVELIGLTFAVFGLVTILLSPIGGRVVDRRGPFPFIVFGLAVMAAMMVSYPFVDEPLAYVPMVALEAVGFSFLGPATYLVIAWGTPSGRSSTAQGVLGAAGTTGSIIASLAAGFLAASDVAFPFLFGSAIVALLLLVAVLVGGSALRAGAGQAGPTTAAAAD